MLFTLMKLTHLIGITLIAAGLFSVLVLDILSRRTASGDFYTHAMRMMAVSYSALALPGAVFVFASGGWLTAHYYGDGLFLETPWLVGMVGFFSLWFIIHLVTRYNLMRLRRLEREEDDVEKLEKAIDNGFAVTLRAFDDPVLILIIVLGIFRPHEWVIVIAGLGFALEAVLILSLFLPLISAKAIEKREPEF